MAELEINYRPQGPISKAFLESSDFIRGIRGPFGSGKSTVCCADILQCAIEQAPAPDGRRYSRWAVARRTYPELKTTTIKTWHEIVPREVGRWIDSGPPTHHIRNDEIDLEVIFLALDSAADVAKLLSMNLTGAWANEAREFPKEVIDGLTGRVGRYPPMSIGGPSWSGIIMDTNPPDTDHWWYHLAERDTTTLEGLQIVNSTDQAEAELRRAGLLAEGQNLFRFFSQPSGMSPEAENTDNLPAGYYQRLMAGKAEDWIKVYVHGQYGFLRDGRPVYPEYSDNFHASRDVLMPQPGKVVVGLDFGLTPAATFHQRNLVGRILCFDEIVSTRMGATAFAQELTRKAAEYPKCEFEFVGDPSGEQGGNDERTVFQILAANGIIARPARTNEFALRRDAVGNCLSKVIDGKPALVISKKCVRLRKALAGGYCYQRIAVVGDRFRDKPLKDMHSHVAESQQYALLEMGENPRAIHPAASEYAPVQPRGEPWRIFDDR